MNKKLNNNELKIYDNKIRKPRTLGALARG